MTEEVGIVKSLEGVIAKVNVPRKSACEGCTLGTCKPDDQSMEIEAFNQAGAEVGQKVRVTIQSYAYIKGSMLVYGIPALSLVVGAVLGKEVFSRFFGDVDPDVLSALLGFGALILSFAIIKIWIQKASKRVETKPIIEEILS